MAKSEKKAAIAESIEDKLRALYKLQCIDNKIHKIEVLRGELPLEVQDLEDEIAGMETRSKKIQGEINEIREDIEAKEREIGNARAAIEKYQEQQNMVRNNREFESLSKEIEFQNLEIQCLEKDKVRLDQMAQQRQTQHENTLAKIADKRADLDHKRPELEMIIAENQVDEERLRAKHSLVAQTIEERLLNAYERIRTNARNGLAVVTFDRNSCGGCFNNIPPQRMVDIRYHKKLIDCEYCGRLLIDPETAAEIEQQLEAED